jgi:hypothetical protein
MISPVFVSENNTGWTSLNCSSCLLSISLNFTAGYGFIVELAGNQAGNGTFLQEFPSGSYTIVYSTGNLAVMFGISSSTGVAPITIGWNGPGTLQEYLLTVLIYGGTNGLGVSCSSATTSCSSTSFASDSTNVVVGEANSGSSCNLITNLQWHNVVFVIIPPRVDSCESSSGVYQLSTGDVTPTPSISSPTSYIQSDSHSPTSVNTVSLELLPLYNPNWNSIVNFPGSCPSGQSVTQIGTTLTCSATSSCSLSPASPCWSKVQKGFKSCTVPTSASSCTVAVSFSPSYSVKPFCCNEVWNGTIPIVQLSSSVSFQQQQVIYIQSVNNTEWVSVPTTETELYGQSNQRNYWYLPLTGGTTFVAPALGQLCMDFGDVGAGTATFTAQWSTDQATWTTLGSGIFNVTATATDTVLCGTQVALSSSVNPATGIYFRVVGSDSSNGNVGIGLISLSLSYLLKTTSNQPNPCYATYNSLTTSGFNLQVQCRTNPVTASTFTMNWWAGIPA